MKHILLLTIFGAVSLTARAQSVRWEFVCAADYIEDAEGSLQWTMGEAFTDEISDGEYTLRIGFLPFALFEGTSSADFHTDPGIALSVSPNPASDVLHVALPSGDRYQLYISGMDGKPVFKTESEHQADIDVSRYHSGVYVLYAVGSSGAFNSITFVKQ